MSTLPRYELSLGDLSRQLDLLNRQVEDRTEKLGLLDSLLLAELGISRIISLL